MCIYVYMWIYAWVHSLRLTWVNVIRLMCMGKCAQAYLYVRAPAGDQATRTIRGSKILITVLIQNKIALYYLDISF